jgi:hypothetical protein
MSRKQKSWILSFAVTVLLSIETFFSLSALYASKTTTCNFVFASSLRGIYACNVFRSFCICDLLIGLIEYNETLSLLEGWIHHLYYICQISIFLWLDISNCFWIFSFCEIPTLAMALIRLFHLKISRNIYTALFIFFRVLVFGYILWNFHLDAPWNIFVYTFPPAALAFGLHVWWSYLLLKKLERSLK